MFSRCLPVLALALVCIRCEAAPLSFNGVELGQKWDEFLKAHPKADTSVIIKFRYPPQTKEQRLSHAATQKMALLQEKQMGQSFNSVYYSFNNKTLIQAMFYAEPSFKERRLVALREPLRNLLNSLGTPTAQGATKVGNRHQWILVWKASTQCAFAYIAWPTAKEQSPLFVDLIMVDAPWRAPHPGFQAFWPAILLPDQENEARRREVAALLEELRPHSIDHIEQLKPVPAIDLFEKTPSVKSKGAGIIKPAK